MKNPAAAAVVVHLAAAAAVQDYPAAAKDAPIAAVLAVAAAAAVTAGAADLAFPCRWRSLAGRRASCAAAESGEGAAACANCRPAAASRCVAA